MKAYLRRDEVFCINETHLIVRCIMVEVYLKKKGQFTHETADMESLEREGEG